VSAAPRWLRFTAGGLEVAVAAAAFRRALPAPWPMPEHVELSGERYPVVDLGALAGAARATSPSALLLALADGAARVVVPVTEISGTIEAGPGEVVPLPWPYTGAERAWCAGVLVSPGDGARAALVLDLGGLSRSSAGVAAVAAVSAGEAAP
jgi:chemotaxis signal transduction protein